MASLKSAKEVAVKAKDAIKEREAFMEMLNSIRMEISEGYRQGEAVVTTKIDPEFVEKIDAIKAHLYVDDRTFTFDERTRELTIDSSECEVPDRD